jgi:AraC-like DNA-binding protein
VLSAACEITVAGDAMRMSGDSLGATELNYEQWRDALRPNWGFYTPDSPQTFAGRVRSRSVYGLEASEISNNARRCERTQRDARLDGVDHWYAVFQIRGRSTIIQNDRAVMLTAGDVALVDSARPVTYVNDGQEKWLSLQLPRRSLVSHLGFEPQSRAGGQGDRLAGRLLYQLVQDAVDDDHSTAAPSCTHMQLAFYDLLGALLAPSNQLAVRSGTDKLFQRVCNIIRDRFADPDLGPCAVAAETGISLRYLQKLFTARNLTCSHVIHSIRLDHAACLLRRRALLGTVQPISEIAYTSGFGDYTNFARRFRRRFGHAPGAHAQDWDDNQETDRRAG